MSWEYRVMRRCHNLTGQKYYSFEIYGVFYDSDGNVDGWDADPTHPTGEDNIIELKYDLERIFKALDKPVLDHKTGEEI